jgi:DNA-binding GntR family transcriptional regulator
LDKAIAAALAQQERQKAHGSRSRSFAALRRPSLRRGGKMTGTAAHARRRNLARLTGRVSTQQIYEDLRAQIVRGELRPGAALTEAAFAARFGLSRTPIREVFWRLGEEGLLRVVPQVGTFVAPISIVAVKDAQFVREALECRAIPIAATTATAADVAALRHLVAEQTEAVAAGAFVRFFALDEAMHRRMLEIAGHGSVWPIIAGAKAQLDRVRYLSLEEPGWSAMILRQHATLIDHLAAKDAAGAERVMAEHLRTAFAAIGQIARQHADFFDGQAAAGA